MIKVAKLFSRLNYKQHVKQVNEVTFAFFFLFFLVQEILIELSTQRKSTRSQWIFFYNNKKKFFQLTEKTLSRFLIVQQKRKDEIEVKRAKALTYCVQV